MNYFIKLTAICAVTVVTACSGSGPEVRNGPQAMHPGDFVRGINKATTAPIQPAVQTVVKGNSSLSAAFATLEQACVQTNQGFPNAVVAINQAGFTKPIEKLSNPDTSKSILFGKKGANYAMGLQYFGNLEAIFGCGIIAPESTELRRAIQSHVAALPNARNVTNQLGSANIENAWAVKNGARETLYIAAKSNSRAFGKGKTYAFIKAAAR